MDGGEVRVAVLARLRQRLRRQLQCHGVWHASCPSVLHAEAGNTRVTGQACVKCLKAMAERCATLSRRLKGASLIAASEVYSGYRKHATPVPENDARPAFQRGTVSAIRSRRLPGKLVPPRHRHAETRQPNRRQGVQATRSVMFCRTEAKPGTDRALQQPLPQNARSTPAFPPPSGKGRFAVRVVEIFISAEIEGRRMAPQYRSQKRPGAAFSCFIV